jgi:MFS family permease
MKQLPPSYKWEMLFWLWLAFFLNQADRAIYGVVLPHIKRSLHLTATQEGLIGAMLFWTLALMVPVAGIAGDRWSRRKIASYSLIFWSCATSLTGLARNWIHLVIFRSVATGGGEAFFAPANYAMIGQFHQKTRSLAMAIHQTSFYLGVISTGFLAGMIAERWGWEASFYMFGSFGVVVGLIMLVRLHDAPKAIDPKTGQPEQPVGTWQAASVLFRTPTAVLLTLAFTADVFVINGYMIWSPTYLQERFDLSLTKAGGFAMLYHYLFAFAGVILGGLVSDRWAARRRQVRIEIQFLGLLLGAPFVYLVGAGTTPLAVYAGMAGFGLFRGIYEANLYASLYDVIPARMRASASGTMLMCAFLVGGTAPLALGMMKDHWGLAVGLSRLSLVFFLGALALLVAHRWFFHRDYCQETDAESSLESAG